MRKKFKNLKCRVQWLMLIILATQEAEVRRIVASPGRKLEGNPHLNHQARHGGSYL
jgi:hypothetical protein